MTGVMLTAAEMYVVLNSRVREAGSVAKLAAKIGLNMRTLANAVNGHKGLGTSVPLALGYQPIAVTVYQLGADVFTAAQMYAVLNARVREAGGVQELATEIGLNMRTLANAVNGHKGLGKTVPLALGYRPVMVTRYQPFPMQSAPAGGQS
ncbi:hypothetical protein [Komagataeibacter oboediens]|uniref:hypothetical protein n=1 Tax=Komagataeibacter oboediens TaxID=65958 RepID=UPI0019B73BF7|nr:hypothetical protein [Komagataeibacter oboediens]GCE81831.1 hypothetical protein MSKU3_3306 [Komagataeibacter oboediens]